MRQVCDFLEVEFDGSLLEPTLGGQPFKGNSMYKSSFNGVSRASLDRWRSVLSPEDIHEVEWLLGPEFDEMGYDRAPGRPPLSARSFRSYLALEVFRIYDHLPGAWKSGFRNVRQNARPA